MKGPAMSARTLLLALAVTALPLSAANFSGKWLLTRQQGAGGATGGGGRGPAPVVVTLNQIGNEVSGSITPPRGNSTGSPANMDVFGGKVDGDTISFYLWTGLDKPVKNMYEGKLNGDEITFTVTLDPAAQVAANMPRSFQVIAKRVP
jgi:hypothetical protein